ncbi:MAG: hypothetical protein IBX61_08800, partial [Thermoleophilia bacterium]|nr:hypothetical protein [Thermoleophilia bacterium]
MHPDESADSIEQRLVLAGKLKPPRLRHVMDRPRLLRLASPANKHKLVLMCAGPGYGKTTLMAQMTRFYPGRNVWYQIDGLDKDPAVFLRHLIAGVSQVCEGVGKRSLSRLEASSDAGQEGTNILGVLADEIREELETPLVICFDDFHLFYGMRFATDFLSCLIGELPSGCTVIIASRTRLRLRLGRLRSQGAVLEIGTRDLQFSMEELKELLSETWGINISEDTLPGLYRSTEGWAAGLVLIEDHLRSGDAVPEMFSGHKVKRKVYEYLVEEVLSRQSDRLRSLLKKSALIDPVDPSICQKALGVKDAPALLAKAEITNLFTTRVGDTKLYRFHPLFREILLARLKENAGENGVQEMRARFGSTFEKAGELKKAIGQYLNSNNHQKAISLIEATGTDMLKKGEHVTLGRWLDALEEMDAPLSPTMKMYRGQILLLEGKPREALKRLN